MLCLSATRALWLVAKKWRISFVSLILSIFLLSSPWPTKIRLGNIPDVPYRFYPDFFWVEHRQIDRYLTRIAAGDFVLLHTAPHVTPSRITPDRVFFVGSLPVVTFFYDPVQRDWRYHDKFRGCPVISNAISLTRLLMTHSEVYFYIFNEKRFRDFSPRRALEFLRQNFQPILQDGNAILYRYTKSENDVKEDAEEQHLTE